VEPTTPCENKTSEEEEIFRQQVIIVKRILVGHGSNGNLSRSISSTSISQVSTMCGGGSTTKFTMVGGYPTIWLLEFCGEGSEDPKKHFLFLKIFGKPRRLQMKIQKWHNW
jgi:hypothetical protein